MPQEPDKGAVNAPENIPDVDVTPVLEEPADTGHDGASGSPDSASAELLETVEETVPASGLNDPEESAAVADAAGDDTPVTDKPAHRKKDDRPKRKLGWRAYILGGSGGTK